ncbi:hypothetical protein AXG93_3825s1030 [Marchantia polymorpha subsp. ruderalis]|uniref:Uncharacterized protein n=1 Tax=Marchantia polymorpha subsp. ruderalis TaxID=1480154 RepID=A0A176W987_MARPO|nr:hypothetical protein AXG93_3825s1030 [Marchantia polymorpha subsp. ruderalis]
MIMNFSPGGIGRPQIVPPTVDINAVELQLLMSAGVVVVEVLAVTHFDITYQERHLHHDPSSGPNGEHAQDLDLFALVSMYVCRLRVFMSVRNGTRELDRSLQPEDCTPPTPPPPPPPTSPSHPSLAVLLAESGGIMICSSSLSDRQIK